MNYASIKACDVANGIGVRVSLFVSGCRHHCEGCFNSEAWDFNYGNPFTEKQVQEILNNLDHDYISGLTLLGGEPLEKENQPEVLALLKRVREQFPDKTIWCYTGFHYEDEVVPMMASSEITRELLGLVDVLVEGRFVLSLKQLGLRFRGSSNQRVLDLKETLKSGNPVILAGME